MRHVTYKLVGEATGLRLRQYETGDCHLVGYYIGKDGEKHRVSRGLPSRRRIERVLKGLAIRQGWTTEQSFSKWLIRVGG